jgi:hypothetical protein
MRANDLLLTLHIVAAATWIGAALAVQVIGGRMRLSTPDQVVDHFALDAETIGKMLFAPAAVVLLITGVNLGGERGSRMDERVDPRRDWGVPRRRRDRRRVPRSRRAPDR